MVRGVIDILHLFLRISDRLTELLINELKALEAIAKTNVVRGGVNRQKHVNMANYESFLSDQLGINFRWKINKYTSKLEYPDLTGPEKIKLFGNIDFMKLLPTSSALDPSKLNMLWSSFFLIIKYVMVIIFSYN